jgi:hypothetical protein
MDAGYVTGFLDSLERAECSVCHRKAIYGDAMRSWSETNEGVLKCGDCAKKDLGPENWGASTRSN